MVKLLTIGIELEFLIATVDTPDAAPPKLRDKRILRHTTHLKTAKPGVFYNPPFDASTMITDFHRESATMHRRKPEEIAEQAYLAGLKEVLPLMYVVEVWRGQGIEVRKASKDDGDSLAWTVMGEDDLQSTEGSPYEWVKVEVTSPPLEFMEENLVFVGRVWEVLKSRFLLDVNERCGLHVHVGDSKLGFGFEHLRRMLAFFWAFVCTSFIPDIAARPNMPLLIADNV